MTTYDWVKLIHVGTVILSFSFFFVRGIWMVLESPKLNQRWVKIVPHINDSILLLSAIVLTIFIMQYPFVQGWLTAKFLLLIVYIGLGMVALRFGKTKAIKTGSWIAALLVFSLIVVIAVTKSINPMS